MRSRRRGGRDAEEKAAIAQCWFRDLRKSELQGMSREEAPDYAGHANSNITDRVYKPAPTKLTPRR